LDECVFSLSGYRKFRGLQIENPSKARSTMQYRTCSDCGWRLREGHGDDRVRWFPLFGSFICGDCERNIGHRNIVRAVNGRDLIDADPNAAEHMTHGTQDVIECQETLPLFSDYDEHGNTR